MMAAAFAVRFALAFAALALVFAALGTATALLLFRAPPERFHGRGFSFETPPGWACEADGEEAVCTVPSRDAIIIAAAKTIGRDDTLDAYRAHLSKQQTLDGAASEVVYVRDETYAGRTWVDSVHRGSEIESYDTRYLGTVVGTTGVLVTVSCHRPACASYEAAISAFVATLQVRGAGG